MPLISSSKEFEGLTRIAAAKDMKKLIESSKRLMEKQGGNLRVRKQSGKSFALFRKGSGRELGAP